ncbi:MAG TPA: beta-L-arabinofuranosidase domain-containing protein [Tepidisphaeraceae bacterium]|nr:beta-L-arabinofuranosidase domain-containing protein [Tepidisphaeraceae bacterium]
MSDSIPRPVAFADLKVGGELARRLQRNFDRLEETKYRPDKLFLTLEQSNNWPGDTEGRTVLGLTLDAQATHRKPKYLDEILHRFPQHVNARGYFGNIEPPGVVDEQQLSSHGWVLRGLCEHYLWKREESDLATINRIIDSLVLPTRGLHKDYPIDPTERHHGGEASGSTDRQIGAWKLSTDIGFDFIFLDGVIQAYQVTHREELKAIIAEMIARFLQIDLVAIKAQTHASLTAMRALLRYYSIAQDPNLLAAVEESFDLYQQHGMTENYENYNWFNRPEWTEPCAVVDSHMVAMQLWQWTRKAEYLELAERIYYNALAFEQRANGGFGTDYCSGAKRDDVAVHLQEAHWCCTMRGGEGMSRVAQSLFFTDSDGVFITHFNDAEAALSIGEKGTVRLREETGYPFLPDVKLAIVESNLKSPIKLRLFSPSWIADVSVKLNGEVVAFSTEHNFVVVNAHFRAGDVINFDFTFRSGSIDAKRARSRKFYYGPMLLATRDEIPALPADVRFTALPDREFQAAGTNVTLGTVYHLLDPKVVEKPCFCIRILFPK